MNKKKITALLISAVLTFTSSICVSASDTHYTVTESPASYADLLGAINVKTDFGNDYERKITVQEFVSILISVMRFEKDADVMEQARGLGIILNNVTEANDLLTWRYALQMSASVLGYNAEVSIKKGDINTFAEIAGEIGLTKNVERPSDGICSVSTALTIVKNMLTAPMLVKNDKNIYRDDNTTLLKTYYKLSEYEGIITAVENTSLVSANGGAGKNRIRLGNRIFETSDTPSPDMLGLKAHIYADDDDNAVYIGLHEYTSVTFTGNDIYESGKNQLSYYDSSEKVHKIKLSDTYNIIKNGQAYQGALTDAVKKYSEIRAVDSERDGTYDTIFVETPIYTVVSAYSLSDDTLYGKNSEKIKLDCSNLTVYSDKKSAVIDKESIKPGDFVKAVISDNGEYIHLTVKDDSLTGRVSSSADTALGTVLTINNQQYYCTEYFEEFGKKNINFDTEYKFFLDNGKIVYTDDGNLILKYGFYISQYTAAGEDNPTVRLLTSDGDIRTFPAENKIKIDGEPKKSASDLPSALTYPQVIAYKTNSSGKITVIDTAQLSNNPFDALNADPNNSLVKYNSTASLLYKSGIKNFGGVCTSSADIFFAVPKDLSTSELDKYGLGSISSFENDTSYTLGQDIDIYNLNEERNPGILVCYGSKLDSYSETTASAVIDSIQECSTEDMQIGYKINYIMSGVYESVYADPSDTHFSLYKKSGKMITSGDIIRFSQKNGYITDITCDFDSELMTMNDTSINFNSTTNNKLLQYKAGYMYSVTDDSILINLSGKTSKSDVTWADSYVYSIPGSGTVLIERTRNTDNSVKKTNIRIIDNSELKAYSDGYAVMRQNYFSPQCLVIYKDSGL